MKMKRTKRKLRQFVKGGTTRLINPDRVREKPEISENGILRQNTGVLRLPDALVEASDAQSANLLPGPIMITISIIAIIFISIIAWFVARMPD